MDEPLVYERVNTQKDLDSFLKTHANTVVIVKFSADWCAPCKQISEGFDSLVASKQQFGLACAVADADSSQELFEEHDIKGMPSFIFFKDNKPVSRLKKCTVDDINAELKSLLPAPELVLDADF